MKLNETLCRIRRLYAHSGPCSQRPARRAKETHPGGAREVSGKSCTSWPEAKTKGQVFRFGPRNKRPLVDRGFLAVLARYFGPSQALTNDLTDSQIKAVCILQQHPAHITPIIEAKRLFVNVAEQVERLNGNMRAVNTALQQTPEVLQPIRVNIFPHILAWSIT